MSELWGHFIGIVIVILIVLFIALWVWAWLPRHRRVFDAMARLPLEHDATPPTSTHEGETSRNNNGDAAP